MCSKMKVYCLLQTVEGTGKWASFLAWKIALQIELGVFCCLGFLWWKQFVVVPKKMSLLFVQVERWQIWHYTKCKAIGCYNTISWLRWLYVSQEKNSLSRTETGEKEKFFVLLCFEARSTLAIACCCFSKWPFWQGKKKLINIQGEIGHYL